MGWFKRLRTRRGFGVHSPFAYSLITDTLRMPVGYAYYDEIGLPDPTMRLMYRIAAHLNVRAIEALDGCSVPRFHGIGKFNLCVFSSEECLGEACRRLKQQHAVLMLKPTDAACGILKAELDTFGHGMTFTCVSTILRRLTPSDNPQPYLLLCPIAHLPRQDFEF